MNNAACCHAWCITTVLAEKEHLCVVRWAGAGCQTSVHCLSTGNTRLAFLHHGHACASMSTLLLETTICRGYPTDYKFVW